MRSFDGKTRTASVVADSKTDRKLPAGRALGWNNISSPDALTSAKGEHCQLVHGDYSQQIHGTVTKDIGLDLKTTIDSSEVHHVTNNQTIDVSGNHREVFAGTCYQGVMGSHLVLNLAVRNETRLARCIETHGDFDEIHDQYDGMILTGKQSLEKYKFAMAQHEKDSQIFGIATSFVIVPINIYVLTIGANLVDASILIGGHAEMVLAHYEHHLLHMEVHGPPKPGTIPPGYPPTGPTDPLPGTPLALTSHIPPQNPVTSIP